MREFESPWMQWTIFLLLLGAYTCSWCPGLSFGPSGRSIRPIFAEIWQNCRIGLHHAPPFLLFTDCIVSPFLRLAFYIIELRRSTFWSISELQRSSGLRVLYVNRCNVAKVSTVICEPLPVLYLARIARAYAAATPACFFLPPAMVSFNAL